MKLHRRHRAGLDRGGEGLAVFCKGGTFIRDWAVIGMAIINKATVGNPFEQLRARPNLQLTPPHVRHFKDPVEAAHGAAQSANPRHSRSFFACLVERLEAETDAEIRLALLQPFPERLS